MTTPDPEQVEARLRKAQRGWLLNAWYGSLGWQINYRAKGCFLGLRWPRSSKLTPLGIAVRNIVEDQPND